MVFRKVIEECRINLTPKLTHEKNTTVVVNTIDFWLFIF